MSYEEEARMSDSAWVQLGTAHPQSLPAAVDATHGRLRVAAPTPTAGESYG
jgi:hypothetical protein